jgi:hypothetical protein
MRPDRSEAFGDILGQQIAVLKTALAWPTLDMEVNPTRPLMPFRRVEPLLLLIGEAIRMKAG